MNEKTQIAYQSNASEKQHFAQILSKNHPFFHNFELKTSISYTKKAQKCLSDADSNCTFL